MILISSPKGNKKTCDLADMPNLMPGRQLLVWHLQMPNCWWFTGGNLDRGMKKIHVVEDDQDIRQIIELILTEEGYKVKAFANVSAFHAGMKEGIPDLYLLDVMLPDGNGMDLCEEIRTTTAIKDIPIIMMSAHAQADLVLKQGFVNDFITKPFDLNDILFRIQKQIVIH